MSTGIDRRRAMIACVLVSASWTSAVFAQSGDPVAIVRTIFDTYAKDSVPKPPYSPALQNRLKRQEIGADFLLDAQDIDVKNANVTPISAEGEKAVVDARFDSFNRKMHLRFDFRVVDGKWMIANVRRLAGGENGTFDMRKWLKLPPLT